MAKRVGGGGGRQRAAGWPAARAARCHSLLAPDLFPPADASRAEREKLCLVFTGRRERPRYHLRVAVHNFLEKLESNAVEAGVDQL